MLQSFAQEQTLARRVPAALLTIAAMIVLPMLIHLLPAGGGAPLGARLLPIFYAPLVAILLFDGWVGATASLVAPILNHWLTGMPTPEMVILLTAELLCFSAFVVLFSRRTRQFWWIGPAAYVLGKAVAWLVVGILPVGPSALTLAGYGNSLMLALPGLAALALLGYFTQRMDAKA